MAIIVFEHSDLDPTLRLGRTLRDHGHTLRIVRPDLGEPIPPDLDDVDGVVSMGGPQSANDSEPWIAAELDYLRQANDAQLPILGICLGNQLLAKALGGDVGCMDGGIELGWQEITLSDVGREDVLHAGLPWRHLQFHWHREEVKKLPRGARILAESKRCAIQSWTLGLRTYGIQFHPEVDLAMITSWADDEPNDLTESGITRELLDKQTRQNIAAFERLTQRLFENIALLLMPVDRRYAGLAKDLHH